MVFTDKDQVHEAREGGAGQPEIKSPAREAEAQCGKELWRQVKELRRANEILKLASAFFAQAELDRRLKS